MKLTFYDLLRVGHIKRWHNVNTTREQTVAEHSYMVMLISLHLFDGLVGVPDDHGGALLLVLGAMFHDSPEAAAGDTPTPAKRLIREVTGDPEIFDKLDRQLMPKLPYLGRDMPLPPAFEEIIKIADAIEGYHFIHDNGSGTHAEIVKAGARRRLEDLVHKADTAQPDNEWYRHVNSVLTAMGLPYVHKESRISPP